MTASAAFVEKIMKEPTAFSIAEDLNQALADEVRRRLTFREDLTPSVKAEFIGGKVVMHSPVLKRHYDSSGNIFILLRTFVAKNNLGSVAHEKALVALNRNDYEPDVCFWGKEKTAEFHDDSLIHPIPDLVVEVLSKSTSAIDRGIKFRDYARHGADEYWIVDPRKRIVEQYFLVRSTSEFALAGTHKIGGKIRSRAVEGFDISVDDIFDETENLAALKNWL